MANIINVTVDDSAETVNVSVSDGIITSSGGGTFINGFLVTKGVGNTDAAIEVGDKIVGWALHVGSEFHVYVKTDYRKRGIGTTLSSKAAKHYGCVLVD